MAGGGEKKKEIKQNGDFVPTDSHLKDLRCLVQFCVCCLEKRFILFLLQDIPQCSRVVQQLGLEFPCPIS